jgi:hypothetical protein
MYSPKLFSINGVLQTHAWILPIHSGQIIPFPLAIAEVEMQDGYFLRLERLP